MDVVCLTLFSNVSGLAVIIWLDDGGRALMQSSKRISVGRDAGIEACPCRSGVGHISGRLVLVTVAVWVLRRLRRDAAGCRKKFRPHRSCEDPGGGSVSAACQRPRRSSVSVAASTFERLVCKGCALAPTGTYIHTASRWKPPTCTD